MIEQAFILAAGFGTRLRPLTLNRPKPLVPILGRAILDYTLDHLRRAGVKRLVINGHYLKDQMADYAKNIQGFSEVLFSGEDDILDSGGGVANCLNFFRGQPFFVINGDSLWQDNGSSLLVDLAKQWDAQKMDALLALYDPHSLPVIPEKFDFKMALDGALTRAQGRNGLMYMGVHVTSAKLFHGAPSEPFSLNQLWNEAIENHRLFGHAFDGRWFHISTPDDVIWTEQNL